MSAVLAPDPLAGCCGSCGHGSPGKFGFIRCAKQGEKDWMATRTACPIGQWIPVTAATMARRAAQEGIERAVAAAERHREGWSEVALSYIRLYSTLNRGKRVIGYDIVQASINDRIIQPPNAKAWGGAIQRAARLGLIVKEGTAEDPNRHSNPVPLWRMVGA